jgi:hypothetical protein
MPVLVPVMVPVFGTISCGGRSAVPLQNSYAHKQCSPVCSARKQQLGADGNVLVDKWSPPPRSMPGCWQHCTSTCHALHWGVCLMPLHRNSLYMRCTSGHCIAFPCDTVHAQHRYTLQHSSNSNACHGSSLPLPRAAVQVVIKLEDAEPQQLRSDVLTAVTTAMNQGWVLLLLNRVCPCEAGP